MTRLRSMDAGKKPWKDEAKEKHSLKMITLVAVKNRNQAGQWDKRHHWKVRAMCEKVRTRAVPLRERTPII